MLNLFMLARPFGYAYCRVQSALWNSHTCDKLVVESCHITKVARHEPLCGFCAALLKTLQRLQSRSGWCGRTFHLQIRLNIVQVIDKHGGKTRCRLAASSNKLR